MLSSNPLFYVFVFTMCWGYATKWICILFGMDWVSEYLIYKDVQLLPVNTNIFKLFVIHHNIMYCPSVICLGFKIPLKWCSRYVFVKYPQPLRVCLVSWYTFKSVLHRRINARMTIWESGVEDRNVYTIAGSRV